MAVSDAFVNFGAEQEFLSADGSIYNAIGILDDSTFVIIHGDGSDSYHSKAQIATVSGSTVSFGPKYEFVNISGVGNYAIIAVLDTAKFIVAYQDETDSGHGTLKIGTVSGTAITFGPETEFLSAGRAAYISMATLDASGFVLSYADWADGNRGKVLIGSVSGTTVSLGSPTTFYPLNQATDTHVAIFDDSTFVLSYRKGNAGDLQGVARVGTASGLSLTLGSEAEFTSIVSNHGVDVIDASKFVIAYRDNGDSGHGTARIGTVSGTSITFGTEEEFMSSGAVSQVVAKGIDSLNFAVLYQDEADSNHGTIKIGTIDGTDIIFGEEAEFLSTTGAIYLDLGILSSDLVVVAYTDVADSNHGTIKLGEASSSSLPVSPDMELRTINHLTKTQDYDPQLISTFDLSPISVNIEVWDIVNGQNSPVTISNSGCYAIGDTDRWGWSTENLPFTGEHKKYHYFFTMISDGSEERFGEFFITVPERGRWSYPD